MQQIQHKDIKTIEEYKEYNFTTEFNTDYKTFRIVGVLDNKK